MAKKKPTVALIYDFDGTLSPGNMQEFGFIQAIGKDKNAFWQKNKELSVKNDASEILCYMNLMIKEAKYWNVRLTRESFRTFGSQIQLFKGVKEWFAMINKEGEELGLDIKHYINSSGLKEMIEGTEIANEFENIYACSFLYDVNGVAEWPAVAVDYTAKTQFLFKINKGILSVRDNKKVNESQAEDNKRIPFPHMIYFGDGETDVPCMKIVKMFGGNSIAVYNPEIKKKVNVARKLLRQGRVNFITPARYTKESRTYEVVCSIIDKIRIDFDLARLARCK